MASKRCRDSLNTDDDDNEQIVLRPRTDEQLRTLIRDQLQMLTPEGENTSVSLEHLINEQNEWLEMSANDNENDQIGHGSASQTNDTTESDVNLSDNEIRRLVTEGGRVGHYVITPRQRFNGVEIQRTLNFREITATTDLAAYNILLHDALNEIVSLSRSLAGEMGYINVSLSGESLPAPINSVLTPDNNHNPDLFIDQIEQSVQSNESVCNDAQLDLKVSIVRDKQGGGRRKLSDLAHNEVIRRNKMNLFCPINVEDNMCFSYCLAHFMNPNSSDQELKKIGADIHRDAGYTPQRMIGFNDISVFERQLDLKIVVFHRNCSGHLEVHKNYDELHPKTIHLYIHDGHYYLIRNLKGFIGSSYVCTFCYKGFESRRLHKCKFACSVCNSSDCHSYPKSSRQCAECLRYCKSSFCYDTHKQPHISGEKSQCDTIKYCDKCGRLYQITNKNKKHKCAPSKCMHCKEILGEGTEHMCFIQPVRLDEHDDKYVYYDFETAHGWKTRTELCTYYNPQRRGVRSRRHKLCGAYD